MADNLLFTCPHCKLEALDLSVHDCPAKRVAADRRRLDEMDAELAKARAPTVELPIPETAAERVRVKAWAALAEVEARKHVAPAKFDRNAYHKEYMREYMRARRAKGK